MKRFLIYGILFLIFFFNTDLLFAKIEIPGRTDSWVNDYAGIIDEDTEAYLNDRISSIVQKTPDPVEVIVTTFPSLEGWSYGEFALRYGEKWRAEKMDKRDNGVVILIVPGDARAGLGVGQNLKGILTDDYVRNLSDEMVKTRFNKGEYSLV